MTPEYDLVNCLLYPDIFPNIRINSGSFDEDCDYFYMGFSVSMFQ